MMCVWYLKSLKKKDGEKKAWLYVGHMSSFSGLRSWTRQVMFMHRWFLIEMRLIKNNKCKANLSFDVVSSTDGCTLLVEITFKQTFFHQHSLHVLSSSHRPSHLGVLVWFYTPAGIHPVSRPLAAGTWTTRLNDWYQTKLSKAGL